MDSVPMSGEDLFDIEMRLLLHGVRQVYGYDFTDYSEASIKRRISQWLALSGYAKRSCH